MNIKKSILFLGLMIGSVIFADSGQEIVDFHRPITQAVLKAFKDCSKIDQQSFLPIFAMAAAKDEKYLLKLHKDMQTLKRHIKQLRKKSENTDFLSQALLEMRKSYKVLEKHRLQIDIVRYHTFLRSELQELFSMVDAGQDILPMLPKFGITKQKTAGLKSFITMVGRYLHKIEEYEDRLHTDWIDLKLANYVLKIELIRLRNAAIFHPWYRGMPIQTSYPR